MANPDCCFMIIAATFFFFSQSCTMMCIFVIFNLSKPIWTYPNLYEPTNLYEPIQTCLNISKTYLNLSKSIWTYLTLSEPRKTYLNGMQTNLHVFQLTCNMIKRSLKGVHPNRATCRPSSWTSDIIISFSFAALFSKNSMYNHVYVRHFQLNRAVKKMSNNGCKKSHDCNLEFFFWKKKVESCNKFRYLHDTSLVSVKRSLKVLKTRFSRKHS